MSVGYATAIYPSRSARPGLSGRLSRSATTSRKGLVGDVGAGIEMNEPRTLIINDRASTKRNVASRHGGGIVTYHATVILDDSATIIGNTAEREGDQELWSTQHGVVSICSRK